MALIAPGAFLWTTYQLQAAATAPDGSSVAGDICFGIAGGWAVVSALYVTVASVRKGRPLLAAPALRQVA
ncbi:MAG TPA: hypothetical protein VF515_11225 [Candidatus Binatia bacterium]